MRVVRQIGRGYILFRKNSIFILELLQKSDVQPLTTKPDNIDYRSVLNWANLALGVVCIFPKNIKKI